MAFLNNAGLERVWGKITAKLNTKVDKVDGKGLSTNDYTTTEKNKLAGIATGANKTIVDSALSSTSTNPVQNKVVNTAITNLSTLVGDTSVSEQINAATDGCITGLSVSGKVITYTKGDGSTGTITTQDTNTTYSTMTGATSSAAGKAGLVPAPAAGKQASFLRGDGTWVVPTNTTYSNMTGATTSAAGKAGLVPAPSAGTATRYLRSDGTWQVPPDTNTTYSAATTSAAGLMSAADKTKLDGIATGATKVTVDSALSTSSTNPVQNKVVNTAITNLNTLVGDTAVSTQITNAITSAASSTTPKAAGTAAVGSETKYARGDHVHPVQTTVSGNAGTATKWATARNINGLSVQGDADRVNYGTCSTAAATAAKVVSCTGFALVTGAEITVKFTVTNTASSPTLNVNSTGAKAIYYRGAAISAGYLAANRTYTFRYNGTQYDLVGDINTDANTTNTAGTTNKTATKLFLVGAASQATAPTTYSNSNVYIGTDNCLYSGGSKVATAASVTAVSNLVGDTAVSTQINNALDAYTVGLKVSSNGVLQITCSRS